MHPSWAPVLVLALLVARAETQSCPVGADGKPAPECAGAVQSAKCVAFRQTGHCDPKGPREPHGDKPCTEEIDSGISGYCECEGGGRARQSTCNHRVFKCDEACLELPRYNCIGWRQTGGCSADGDREPNNDKPCVATIEPGMSGFCECGGGRIVKRPGCEKGEELDPFTCEAVCAGDPDMYEELNLDASCLEKDIKSAFRKLSLKYHPDKTRGDPALTARFNAIREAYEVLSNTEHRAVYDLGGMPMLKQALGNKLEKGPAMQGSIGIPLEHLYNGHEMTTRIQRKVICRGCRNKNSPRCNQCTVQCANEVKLVNVQMGPFMVQQQQEVPSQEKCKMKDANLEMHIDRGMASGDQLEFKGMGEQRPEKLPGDTTIKLEMTKHNVFTRRGNDLKMSITISLKEALLGFTRTFQHLDKREITVKVDSITEPMATMKILGEGMPFRGDPTTHGDLYIKCYIRMPIEEQLQDTHRQWLTENFPS